MNGLDDISDLYHFDLWIPLEHFGNVKPLNHSEPLAVKIFDGTDRGEIFTSKECLGKRHIGRSEAQVCFAFRCFGDV